MLILTALMCKSEKVDKDFVCVYAMAKRMPNNIYFMVIIREEGSQL